MTDDPNVRLRALAFADLPQVLAIERRSYPAPWSLAMFVLELGKPAGVCLAATAPGTDPAADLDGLRGYAIVTRYEDAHHVMNICVDPDHRRSGIARAMLERVVVAAGGPQARLTLEVRPSNHDALALYRDLGFRAIGVRRRYYQDDGEDALIMWRTPDVLQGRTDDVPAAGPIPPDVPLPSELREGLAPGAPPPPLGRTDVRTHR